MNTRTNKRKHQRARVRWMATCEGASGRWIKSQILDVSPFGMFLRLDETSQNELTMGDPIRVWFWTSDFRSREIEVIGTVRWRGKSPSHGCVGVGIQFETMCEEIAQSVSTQAGNVESSPGRIHFDQSDGYWCLPNGLALTAA